MTQSKNSTSSALTFTNAVDVVQECKEGRFGLPNEGASEVGTATSNLKPNSSSGMSLFQS